jgi:hypothetical protein
VTLQIDFWQFLAMEAAIVTFFAGLLFKVGHVLLSKFIDQFETRLQEKFAEQEAKRAEGAKAWEERFASFERHQRDQERGLNALKEEMLREYVRREDNIRDQTVTQAKLDALGAKLELMWRTLAERDAVQRRES